MKKKLIALPLVGMMCVSLLAGCGGGIDTSKYDNGGASKTEEAADSGSTDAAADTAADTSADTSADSGEAAAESGGDSSTAATGDLTYADGTTLRMATGYNSKQTGIAFDAETAGEGITLADGNTYRAGDLKPTWVQVEKELGVKFEDKYQGNPASDEFEYWKERLTEVDMLSGNAAKLTEYGEAGSIINIGEHLDQMPNFKAYLEANPIVRLSITGNTNTGAIYFSPYFDGVNDIERMPLMRVDWAQKLLDGEGEFSADASGNTPEPKYEPYMPTSGKVEIDVLNLDGETVDTIAKDYDKAGNIIDKMNQAGSMSGVDAVNMLRTYIDEAYDGYYGTDRSNLFIGQNAAWDADEMVALLRCVKANSQTLNGTDSIQPLFAREDNNNQRRVDLVRFAGHLFGVRGLESRQDYLFIDTDGQFKDARQEQDAYKAMERMHTLAEEELLSKSFMDNSEESSTTMLENDLGFMSYDYNQTQTLMNETKLQDGEKYMAVMVPVACWQDGTDGGNYMRFTESWRSVKTDGWGISKPAVENDPDKLNAALKLIDFAYSDKGLILMTYGPDAFIKMDGDKYSTFEFNGNPMPEIADATYEELWEKADGNYTNYARMYLGSTLSFVKNQAFEFQCTCEVGKEGAGNISKAIAAGTISHPELEVTDNPWYTSVPTVLPTTKQENDLINTYTDLSTKGKFSMEADANNEFVKEIVGGYTEEGMGSAEAASGTVKDTYGGSQYLKIKQTAYDRLMDFYNAL